MAILLKFINLLLSLKNKFHKHFGQSYFGTVIVAEYPKCGGSMLVSMLANILNENKYANFYAIGSNYSHSYEILNYFDHKNLERQSNKLSIAKTHLPYSFKFKTIICLYRNPLDAIKSYYIMLRSYGRLNGISLDEFALSPLGIDSYVRFYLSYLKAPQSSRIVFVSYEDILEGHLESLNGAVKFICGRLYSPNLIKSIVNEHSLSIAKKHEAEYALYDLRRFNSAIKFIDNKDLGLEYSQSTIDFILAAHSKYLPSFSREN